MNVPLTFIAVITCLMALYMMNRFIKSPGVVSVLLLLIQFFAASIIVFSLIDDVLTTPQIEFAVILAGVVLPAPVVVYDHISASRRRKKTGANVPYIEKKEKKRSENWNVSFFTGHAELWKEEINGAEVFGSLSLQDSRIMKNLKKQLMMIQRLINMEKYEMAAEQYRFLFSILPDSAAIAYNAGFLHCFVGKYREAYKILKRALINLKGEEKTEPELNSEKSEKYPTRKNLETMIYFNMGYALYHLGKFEFSIRFFQKVLETKPDLTVAYKNIARAFLSVGMDGKAIEFLEKGRVDLRDSRMRIVLGSIYYRKGDTKKALEVLDEAVHADEKQIEALKWRGKAALRENMYDKAVECFRTLVQKDPSEPTHYYHLALAQRALGETANALKTYDMGIAANPGASILLYNAATLLDEAGRREKAVRYLYKSMQGDEVLEDAYNYLGVLLGQMKRYRESVQVFDRGIQLFPRFYQLHFNRGIVLEMSRRLEDAANSFERAYDLNRQDPVLIYHYTAALLRLREYSKAIRICKMGLSDFPDDAELIYGLSKVYAQMGEKDVAIDLLKKVLELDPAYLIRLRADLDFKALCSHPGYQKLMVS